MVFFNVEILMLMLLIMVATTMMMMIFMMILIVEKSVTDFLPTSAAHGIWHSTVLDVNGHRKDDNRELSVWYDHWAFCCHPWRAGNSHFAALVIGAERLGTACSSRVVGCCCCCGGLNKGRASSD